MQSSLLSLIYQNERCLLNEYKLRIFFQVQALKSSEQRSQKREDFRSKTGFPSDNPLAVKKASSENKLDGRSKRKTEMKLSESKLDVALKVKTEVKRSDSKEVEVSKMKIETGKNMPSYQLSESRSDVKCYRCNKVGHKRYECPAAELGLWYCYYCLKMTHHVGTECSLNIKNNKFKMLSERIKIVCKNTRVKPYTLKNNETSSSR